MALLRPCGQSLLIPAVRREPCEVQAYRFGDFGEDGFAYIPSPV